MPRMGGWTDGARGRGWRDGGGGGAGVWWGLSWGPLVLNEGESKARRNWQPLNQHFVRRRFYARVTSGCLRTTTNLSQDLKQ